MSTACDSLVDAQAAWQQIKRTLPHRVSFSTCDGGWESALLWCEANLGTALVQFSEDLTRLRVKDTYRINHDARWAIWAGELYFTNPSDAVYVKMRWVNTDE